jgi:Domain of unknown function (DUF4403)
MRTPDQTSRNRTTGLLKLAAPLALLGLTACNQEVHFTRDPFPGPQTDAETKLGATTVFVGAAVDLSGARAQIDASLADKITPIVQLIDNGACGRRNNQPDCNDAKVDGDVERDGPVTLDITSAGRIELTVPMRYVWKARGIGWARDITDQSSGTFTVKLPYDVAWTSAYTPEVRIKEDGIVWSEPQIKVLKGKLSLPKLVEAKLRKSLNGSGELMRKAVAETGVKDTVANAWAALYRPIELSAGSTAGSGASIPALWLKSEPERVFPAGLTTLEGRTFLRFGIAGQFGIVTGARPSEAIAKRVPEPQRADVQGKDPAKDPGAAQTNLKLPVLISLAPLKKAVAGAFPKDEIIETQADAQAVALAVSMKSASVYPSRHHVVIDFAVDVARPRQWLGYTGRAQLLGRPVLRRDEGIVELKDLTFPALSAKDAKDAKVAKKPLRIGQEPFARRFGLIARMDIAKELQAGVDRANGISEMPVGDGLVLSGRFDKSRPASIEIARDGLLLQLPLDGELMLRAGSPPGLPAAVTTGSVTGASGSGREAKAEPSAVRKPLAAGITR